MYKKVAFSLLFSLISVVGFIAFTSTSGAITHVSGHESARALLADFGHAITYQGVLEESGEPADGLYDFVFDLYDTEALGTGVLISSVEINDHQVSDGLFMVNLDFGDVFDGTQYWLQVSVRPGASTEAHTPLSPRQVLTATPYAHYATRAESASWSGLIGIPPDFADNLDNDILGSLSCMDGAIPEWTGSAWVCGTDDIGGGDAAWSLTGNAGTTAGPNFLGTVDDQPLEFHVFGSRALRLEPGAASPNLIGGYAGNIAGAVGATVGGGGRDLAVNQASGDYSSVDGGAGNISSGYASAVGGGEGNTASGSFSTMSGGASNMASTSYTTIGGGRQNDAGGVYAAIAGGQDNTASAAYAAIAGGQGNAVSGQYAIVGGGSYNHVAGSYAVIAGGGPSDLGNPTTSNNRVWDDYGVVGGGGGNIAGNNDSNPTSAEAATVAGGLGNVASAMFTSVSGGSGNTASGYAAVVGGGTGNSAFSSYATVAGGTSNLASDQYSVVSGGRANSAEGPYSTVGGGYDNQVAAGFGTIPGGVQNYVAGDYGFAAGYQATAGHQGAFVWSDSTGAMASSAPNQFLIDADGGVGIGTDNPVEMLTVNGSAFILGSGVLIPRSETFLPSKILQAPSAVYASGTTLYVTSFATNTLTILDGTYPYAPRYITHETDDMGGPMDVQVLGGKAYVASVNNDSLVVLDVSDPAQSYFYDSSTESLNRPVALYVSGNYAYLASEGETGTGSGLTIFDLTSSQDELKMVAFTDEGLSAASDVFVSGGHAYLTSRDNDRLVVFDVREPGSPQLVGFTAESLDGPVAVHIRDYYAYVLAANSNNLVIFDVSDKASISLLGQVTTALTQPSSLYLSGNYAYVTYAGDPATAANCGLAVFDISDPAAIETLAVIDMSDTAAKPVSVYGSGNYIYVANMDRDSLSVYEINHFQAPAATIGNVRSGYLEVNNSARVNNDLSVDGGLHVGSGGARIEGGLSVNSSSDSYFMGALSVGGSGVIITETISTEPPEWEEIWITAPTHTLDVIGEGRFRVNDYNNLLIRSPNVGSDEDVYIDFFRTNRTDSIVPSARIEFDAADPLTHTTGIRFHTQSAGDTSLLPRVEIAAEGNLRPAADNQISLGESGKRWTAVFAVNGVIQTSDSRAKQDVTDLAYGLAEINRLRPVTFHWIDDPSQSEHVGLIAQEVAQVLPDVVVAGDDPHRSLGLNYAEIVPVLINAVQEQQAEIDTQNDRISELEARLADLESDGRFNQGAAHPLGSLSWMGLAGLMTAAAVFIRRRS